MPSDDRSGDTNSAARARHALLGQLFAEAVDLDAAARKPFLAARTAHDPSLRRELDALLAAVASPRIVQAIDRGVEREAALVDPSASTPETSATTGSSARSVAAAWGSCISRPIRPSAVRSR